jgi:hypothetical protein
VLTPPSGWWSGAKIIVVQALLTVAAAALSYRFVEQPIRTGRLQKRLAESGARREVVAAAAAALVVAFALLFVAPSATNAQASGSTTTTTTTAPTTTTHHPGHNKHRKHRKHPQGNRLPRGHFLAIGDSVMDGCASALRSALDNRVRVDAAVARQVDQTSVELTRLRHKYGSLRKVVIVQVGNNGPLYFQGNDGLITLRHVLRGVPDVIVVNVRNSTPWEHESNSAITEWLKGWPQAHLADWYHNSKDSMLSDGTHPWPQYCPTYARVIKDALRGTSP